MGSFPETYSELKQQIIEYLIFELVRTFLYFLRLSLESFQVYFYRFYTILYELSNAPLMSLGYLCST